MPLTSRYQCFSSRVACSPSAVIFLICSRGVITCRQTAFHLHVNAMERESEQPSGFIQSGKCTGNLTNYFLTVVPVKFKSIIIHVKWLMCCTGCYKLRKTARDASLSSAGRVFVVSFHHHWSAAVICLTYSNCHDSKLSDIRRMFNLIKMPHVCKSHLSTIYTRKTHTELFLHSKQSHFLDVLRKIQTLDS